MKNQTFHIALAVALIVSALAVLGPALDADDWRSAAADDAIKEHAAEIKQLRAAMAMCGGENAVAESLGNGEWQCLTKRGHKTQIASAK